MTQSRGALQHVKVGLALPGGGARGLTQVGVLKVLEREGIPIDLIAGTSMGAIVGGLYASLAEAAEVERRLLAILDTGRMARLDLRKILEFRDVLPVGEGAPGGESGLLGRVQKAFRRLYTSHVALTRMSVLKGDRVERVLTEIFEGRSFDQLKIPFAAVAVDLGRACQVVIANGPLAPAVAASSAIAGIFPPVEIDGRLLIDGGYTSPVPIDAAQALGANVVVAVDVSERGLDFGPLDNGVEVAMRSSEISLVALEREQLLRADVVISTSGKSRHWSDFSEPQEAIAAGERAATEMLSTVRAKIDERARLFL